ncbi:MAG: AAA family ATPase [Faecalibacterium sp.]
MNFETFNGKLLKIKSETKSYSDSTLDPKEQSSLKKFMDSIDSILNFTNSAHNLELLHSYKQNSPQVAPTTPFGNLCNDINTKLAEIEPLLIPNILNNMHNRTSAFKNLFTKTNSLLSTNLLSAFDVLKHLDGHNKTLIILGPNGSGKTSFANHLKTADSHIKIVPANKPIIVSGNPANCYTETISSVRNELFENTNTSRPSETLLKLIVSICSEHDNCAREYYDTDAKKKTVYTEIKQIFDVFFEVKLNNSNFGKREMLAENSSGTIYEFNNMSDGERAAFFYIATVIIAPPSSFIIVDEPENHLNPAIYNKIWDRLIQTRADCQFIFISHTMDFINARSNFELVKIKSFTHPNQFDFEFLGSSLEDIDSSFIVDIVGSRKPILFCEGSKTDYDYTVYETLFGDRYTIIAAGNCTAVINSVNACNAYSTRYSIQTAIGIIDSDLKSEAEINALIKKKIFPLKCNEIEMLLLDELIFKKALKHTFGNPAKFESFKSDFLKKLTSRKDAIIKRLVKTQIDETLHTSVLDDKKNRTKEELKSNLKSLIEQIDIDHLWASCDEKITTAIESRDYDAALRYCCLGHNEIIGGLANPIIPDYAKFALGLLKSDSTLASSIKAKYFSSSDFSI